MAEVKRVCLRRKNRSPRETYQRKIASTYRCPRYYNEGRWTAPQDIMLSLEMALVKHAAGRKIAALYTFAQGQAELYGPRRGSAPLEYAWVQWTKNRRLLSEDDVTSAVDSGEVGKWYARLCSKYSQRDGWKPVKPSGADEKVGLL